MSILLSLLCGVFLACPCEAQSPKYIRPVLKSSIKTPSKNLQLVRCKYCGVPCPILNNIPKMLGNKPIQMPAPCLSGIEYPFVRGVALRTLQYPRPVLQAFPGKQEIDAVIFDLDGTLLDSLGAWEHSGSNFVRSQGFEPPDTLDDELVPLSLLDGAKLIKARYQLSQSPEEILALTLRPIRQHYYEDILPMPGVSQTLARLKAQGVKMAVATASDRELAERSLRRLGLRDYFEFIITCDEVGVGKSSPKVYEEALRRLGTGKARTLVAEDALHALQTAHRAGFPTAAIEEAHSAAERTAKEQAATYYVLSYQGKNVYKK